MSNTDVSAWYGHLPPDIRTPLSSEAVENVFATASVWREVALQKVLIFLQFIEFSRNLLVGFSRLIPLEHETRSSRSGFLLNIADQKHHGRRTSQESLDNIT